MKRSFHPQSMNLRKILAVFSLTATLCSPAFAQEINRYWIEYGNEPVLIQQNNNGSNQTLKFVAFTDGMMVAELEGGVGEVSLPVSESTVKNLRLDGRPMRAVNQQLRQENYEAALETLRPYAYPLIKFHQIPDNFNQLHTPIRTLIDTLVTTGEYTEAEDILSRIQLDKVGVKYSESAIRLMNAYFAEENYEAGEKLAKSLPVKGDYSANIRSIVDAADALRAAGKYQAVIPLYQEILKVVNPSMRQNVEMWLAYCLVLADRLDEATPMIESLNEPKITERTFSLYKLLQGSREHRLGNYGQSLDLLTRGFVRAQTSYDWVPEMLFLIGDCYARLGDNLAARNVWTEITSLYPSSPWAKRAETSLTELQ